MISERTSALSSPVLTALEIYSGKSAALSVVAKNLSTGLDILPLTFMSKRLS